MIKKSLAVLVSIIVIPKKWLDIKTPIFSNNFAKIFRKSIFMRNNKRKIK